MAQIADFYPDEPVGSMAGPVQRVDEALNVSRTPGEALRLQREKLGITLEDAYGLLRIRAEYLQALEEQNFKVIPSQGYAKAWLRKYAQYLQLDPDQVVARFEAENAIFEVTPVETVDMGKRSIGARGKVSALAIGLLCVGGAWFAAPAIFRQFAPPKPEAPSAILEGGKAETLAGASPVANSAATALVIRARTASWLEARGPDGTIFLSRDLLAGESYEPSAGQGWIVFANDGGAFEVLYGGNFVGLLGEPGVPVHAYRLEEAVKAAEADAAAAKEAQAVAMAASARASAARAAAANAAAFARPRPLAELPQADTQGSAAPAAESATPVTAPSSDRE